MNSTMFGFGGLHKRSHHNGVPAPPAHIRYACFVNNLVHCLMAFNSGLELHCIAVDSAVCAHAVVVVQIPTLSSVKLSDSAVIPIAICSLLCQCAAAYLRPPSCCSELLLSFCSTMLMQSAFFPNGPQVNIPVICSGVGMTFSLDVAPVDASPETASVLMMAYAKYQITNQPGVPQLYIRAVIASTTNPYPPINNARTDFCTYKTASYSGLEPAGNANFVDQGQTVRALSLLQCMFARAGCQVHLDDMHTAISACHEWRLTNNTQLALPAVCHACFEEHSMSFQTRCGGVVQYIKRTANWLLPSHDPSHHACCCADHLPDVLFKCKGGHRSGFHQALHHLRLGLARRNYSSLPTWHHLRRPSRPGKCLTCAHPTAACLLFAIQG